MPRGRDLFLSIDMYMYPEWLKLSAKRDAFLGEASIAAVEEQVARPPEVAWVHAKGRAGNVEALLPVIARISRRAPCVVLADVPDDADAMKAFSAGARGYCNSHANARVLKQVREVVLRGGLWVGESLMGRLVAGVAAQASGSVNERVGPAPAAPAAAAGVAAGYGGRLAVLTVREHEVAQAIASGASNKEAARRLGITERTVKSHLTTIFDKLGVKDRLRLAITVRGQDR